MKPRPLPGGIFFKIVNIHMFCVDNVEEIDDERLIKTGKSGGLCEVCIFDLLLLISRSVAMTSDASFPRSDTCMYTSL